MACDRCGARIEGGAYPSDDEGSQDLCFDCAVADGAKNVAEAIQCAHGRRYGEPCPLQARVKELERERDEARAEALRILRLCADRPNLDHIPFQPAPVEDWFNRIDNAGKGGA